MGHNSHADMSLDYDFACDNEISFYVKTSTETGYDFLVFYVDGERKGRWAGETGWTYISYMISEGTHHLTWSYEKDGGATGGQDCVWVDNIVLPPMEVVLDVEEDGPSTPSTGSGNAGTFAFYNDGNFIINNPATGSGSATLQIIDMNGRILKSESINGCASISVNAAPGIYMLRLINGNAVKVQKIVVE